MRIAIAVAAAGFLGAITRYEIGFLFADNGAGAFPWATLLINLTGSLLLGLLLGRAARRPISPWLREAAGTGFLGAYTTFSAFNGQLWQLLQHNAYTSAAIYACVSGAGGWLLASVGLKLGGRGGAA